jgi:lipopolysaccharide export LptBFGC system permease protein LptF
MFLNPFHEIAACLAPEESTVENVPTEIYDDDKENKEVAHSLYYFEEKDKKTDEKEVKKMIKDKDFDDDEDDESYHEEKEKFIRSKAAPVLKEEKVTKKIPTFGSVVSSIENFSEESQKMFKTTESLYKLQFNDYTAHPLQFMADRPSLQRYVMQRLVQVYLFIRILLLVFLSCIINRLLLL